MWEHVQALLADPEVFGRDNMSRATAIQRWMCGRSTNAPGWSADFTALEREKTR